MKTVYVATVFPPFDAMGIFPTLEAAKASVVEYLTPDAPPEWHPAKDIKAWWTVVESTTDVSYHGHRSRSTNQYRVSIYAMPLGEWRHTNTAI